MFSSGPTKKFPTFNLNQFDTSLLGRSHRSKDCKQKIMKVIQMTKSVLQIPDNYVVAIITGSTTSAVECAIVNFLGYKHVDVIAFDVFGKIWLNDVEKLGISHTKSELNLIHNPQNDLLFTWNGTTSGQCVPHGDWIHDQREGITICDLTSCAFCVEIPWNKLDVSCFSWQKGLGSEAAHGMIVISPRGLERLQVYKPKWFIPKLFTLNQNVLSGEPINTPSMLVVEDYYQALLWANELKLEGLVKKVNENFNVIKEWVESRSWVKFLSKKFHSKTSVCLVIDNAKQIAEDLEKMNLAYDILNHRDAPTSLRIWCGPTVDSQDIKKLLLTIDLINNNN